MYCAKFQIDQTTDFWPFIMMPKCHVGRIPSHFAVLIFKIQELNVKYFINDRIDVFLKFHQSACSLPCDQILYQISLKYAKHPLSYRQNLSHPRCSFCLSLVKPDIQFLVLISQMTEINI